MQLAQEEPQPIDKAALVVAFVEAMQANMAQSSNPSQADMDEAIRKQKELEEMCACQRQIVLLYEERRQMESVHSPATIQEMLKLSLAVRKVVLDLYEEYCWKRWQRSRARLLNRTRRSRRKRKMSRVILSRRRRRHIIMRGKSTIRMRRSCLLDGTESPSGLPDDV